MNKAPSPPSSAVAPSWCAWHPWLPWAAPFVVYVAILASRDYLPLDAASNHLLRLLLSGGIILFCSRKLFSLRPVAPLGSVLVGIAVFLVWVAPDALFPGYRSHWLFSNSLLGHFDPNANAEMATAPASFFALRIAVSMLLVPILEELFWRGFIMRILIRNDFESVPLGTWQRNAFLLTALLFALEHGVYWDVGLAAGLAYNAWMVRTKSLGDLIWAHAITNGLLAAYVIVLGKWEFWP
ncbi:MAG: CAAX prenyl protease-related protein [Bryobacterales bacterium]|nr:CAAX prenyl protease-related protein [Bryobacterales bacterium]